MATFEEIEESEYSGAPLEIYNFVREFSSWKYTSSGNDIVIDTDTYLAIPMERKSIEQTQEVSRSFLTITMTKTNSFVSQYIQSPPSGIINLTISKYHPEQTDDPKPIWIGRVVNVSFTDRNCEIRCEPLMTSFDRSTLRRLFQPTCPHVLYGSKCLVNASSFSVSGVISLVNGLNISSTALTAVDNYWAGGYIDFLNSDSVIERRFITTSTGTQISLNLTSSLLVAGKSFTAYPGCDHTLTTCNEKFSNEDNYGGQPFMTINGKNPFGSNPIF